MQAVPTGFIDSVSLRTFAATLNLHNDNDGSSSSNDDDFDNGDEHDTWNDNTIEKEGGSIVSSQWELILATPDQRRNFIEIHGGECGVGINIDNNNNNNNNNNNSHSNDYDNNENPLWERYTILSNLLPPSPNLDSSIPPFSSSSFTNTNTHPHPVRVEEILTDLWKYCAIASGLANVIGDHGMTYPLGTLDTVLPHDGRNRIVRILTETQTQTSTSTTTTRRYFANPSVMALDAPSGSGRIVAHKMIRLLLELPLEQFWERDYPAWRGRELYRLSAEAAEVEAEVEVEVERMPDTEWEWLEADCGGVVLGSGEVSISGNGKVDVEAPEIYPESLPRYCARDDGSPCCRVRRVTNGSTNDDGKSTSESTIGNIVMLLRHPLGSPPTGPLIDLSPRTATTTTTENNNNKNDADRRHYNEGGRGRLPYLHYIQGGLDGLGKITQLANYTVTPHEASFMSVVRTNNPFETNDHASSSRQREGYNPIIVHPNGKMTNIITTPNFFQMLFENSCLPTGKACHDCLKKWQPPKAEEDRSATCLDCQVECGCYCGVLCQTRPPRKRQGSRLKIYPPVTRKDRDRIVPRIVHQTYFETITKEKYPNMSRLIEGWKKSGWEYNFYDDDAASDFLRTHFPPEVQEAYDAILPGAFKADLFRYCVLLIRGGVYADMDLLLTSNLDEIVPPDIGFMVPQDEPGTEVKHRSCLWNGLLVAAPGHPFLARTIEMVVNNARNRFTSVDFDDMLCPDPVLRMSHQFDTLFVSGPCALGASVNAFLGRHMQEEIKVGDLHTWHSERDVDDVHTNKEKIVIPPDDERLLIPGRTVILIQNKEDMGAHCFTWLERNTIFACTDLPNYDDRPKEIAHYSSLHVKTGVFGVKKLYVDDIIADEVVSVVVQPVV